MEDCWRGRLQLAATYLLLVGSILLIVSVLVVWSVGSRPREEVEKGQSWSGLPFAVTPNLRTDSDRSYLKQSPSPSVARQQFAPGKVHHHHQQQRRWPQRQRRQRSAATSGKRARPTSVCCMGRGQFRSCATNKWLSGYRTVLRRGPRRIAAGASSGPPWNAHY